MTRRWAGAPQHSAGAPHPAFGRTPPTPTGREARCERRPSFLFPHWGKYRRSRGRGLQRSVAFAAFAASLLAAGSALAQPPGDAANGASVFDDRCTLCHAPDGGGQGPSLKGVVGRKAGSLAGFHYSPALAGSNLTWTAANLDRFLAGPSDLVPGTAMRVILANPADRRDVVAYLATLKP